MRFEAIPQWRVIIDDQVVYRDTVEEINDACEAGVLVGTPESVWAVYEYSDEHPEGEVICDCYSMETALRIIRAMGDTIGINDSVRV